jgi:lysozyme
MTERQRMLDAEMKYYMERHTPIDEGYDRVVRYAREGEATVAAYLPQGRVSLSGFRPLANHSKHVSLDARGRLVIGRMVDDTLLVGVRIDSAGFYAGQMNRRGEAWGHGFYRSADGAYFEGHWEHDQREGFGLSIGRAHLHVGVWLYDRFRGEHFVHHSDRIYGIDISRYQHEKGRRHFSVSWDDLRIRHLGRRISQECAADKVDYPVRFVYIKSTEGVTIENKYYEVDDSNARSHGLHVGAYHFFSTRTPADEQARHFLSCTRFRHGDLPPMLDIEPSDKQIEEMGGPLVLFDAMRTWLKMVEQATHTRPLLYINQRFVNTYMYLAPDLRDYRFWVARYGEYKPDVHLDLWQLSGDGRVQGFMPEVDLNVFNGYQEQWDDFLRTATIP